MKTLPEDFRTYTQALMGEKLYQRLEHAILEEEAPTSIRINPFKCKDADGEPVPWCPETGRYLSTRPGFTFDPLLHAGLYYVQEASSMFVDMAIRQYVKEPELPCRKGVCSSATNRCAPAHRFLPKTYRSSVIRI